MGMDFLRGLEILLPSQKQLQLRVKDHDAGRVSSPTPRAIYSFST